MKTKETHDDFDLVELLVAPNPVIAEMILSMLRAEDIPAHVNGRYLQDEWAIAQMVLGRTGVTVQVAAKDLERARDVLQIRGDTTAVDA